MYLKKLEINGFKSFAKKTSFEFSRGITSIVGPNGSGKSNVAESIRWVMGEQSLKSLRGKKGTDVIFSGSDKASRLGLAEVSLFFDNSDGHEVVDFSELVISRKIYRDGHGEYFVNNQPSRLQDILMLLAQINLSSKTYSVISQGMVDMILSISAAERKEFFEEASGVKPLQMKKAEAMRKLAATSDNLETLEIQLNEISPRLRSLTRQVKRLEERVVLENKLRDLQYHYFGETLFLFKKEQVELRAEEKKSDANIRSLEKEIQQLQEKMFSLTRESSHSDQFSDLQQQYQDLFKDKTALKEEELSLRSQLLQSVKESEKKHVPVQLVRQVHAHWKKISERIEALHAQSNEISTPEDISMWSSEANAIGTEMKNVFDPLKSFVASRDSKGELDTQMEVVAKKIKEVDTHIKRVQEQITKLTEAERQEKDEIWKTQNLLQEKQAQLNQFMNEKNEHTVKRARVETRIGDTELEIVEEMGEAFLHTVLSWKEDPEQPSHKDIEATRQEMHKLKHQLEVIGGIDPEVSREYEEIKSRFDFLSSQSSDLRDTTEQLNGVIEELDETIKKQFNASFKKINEEFQKFFKMLFSGGKSELKLIKAQPKKKKDPNEDLGESLGEGEELDEQPAVARDEIVGVEIHATPPGKKLKSIHMLSGGERALTSIALICAIISNNPAPFVVLDEVDAALDEANSIRFSEIIAELSHRTQFIVVTHNRATMEKARLLYGVTMGDDGISKLLSLKLEDATQYTNR